MLVAHAGEVTVCCGAWVRSWCCGRLLDRHV